MQRLNLESPDDLSCICELQKKFLRRRGRTRVIPITNKLQATWILQLPSFRLLDLNPVMLPIRLGKVLNPLRNGFSKLHVTTPKILRLLCRKKPVRGSPPNAGTKILTSDPGQISKIWDKVSDLGPRCLDRNINMAKPGGPKMTQDDPSQSRLPN